MTREDARELFSDYSESTLDPTTKDALQRYLSETPEAAAELIAFQRTLTVIHRLPAVEPSLDLWREFAPMMAEYQSELKMNPVAKLQRGWSRMASQVCTGIILFTHAVAARSWDRFERYLLHESVPVRENNKSEAG